MFVHFLNLGNQYSLGKNVKHCQFPGGGGGRKVPKFYIQPKKVCNMFK